MAKLRVTESFGVIPNLVLNDDRLSFKAKGLYGYIQSKPDGWDFSAERMARDSNDGRDSIRAGLRELEAFGYLVRTTVRDGKGYFEHSYELRAKSDSPITDNPTTENPSSDNPTSDNPSCNKEVPSKKELSKKESGTAFLKEFEEFIRMNANNKTAIIVSRMMKLGFKPKESVESFRDWLSEMADSKGSTPELVEKASHEWYVYWSARPEKPIKNHKTSLMNTPLLNKDKQWKK